MSAPPLRVFHILPTLSLGGAELFVQRMCAHARSPEASDAATLRIEPFVCAMHRGGPVEERLLCDGTPHAVLGVQRTSVRRPLRALADARTLRNGALAAARAHGTDLVQTHLPDADWLGMLVARALGVPLILTYHSVRLLPPGRSAREMRGRLRRRLRRRAQRRAAAIVAVGREVALALQTEDGVDPARIQVVPSAIAAPAELDPAARAARRAALQVPAGAPLLVSIGRLVPSKAHDLALEAFARLRRTHPGARLVIAGEGPERPRLEARIGQPDLAGSVQLLGARDDVAELLGCAELYLTATRHEGLGLAAAEALAAGLPVVGFAVAGVTEVVRDGATGLLVSDGAVGDLAAAAARLLADAPLRERLGAAGPQAASRFGVARVHAETAAVYASLSG